MLANRTSRWSLAAALLCLVLLAASWFLLISPRRADASEVRAQAVQTDAQAAQLQVDIAELKAQFADLPKQAAQLAAIKKQLPPKAGVPDLVRDLRQFATQSGVSLDSLTPSAPAILSATGAVPATTAVPGSVVTIPLQLGVTGDYFEASLFIKNLQTKLGRSMLITALDVAPAREAIVTATTAAAPTTTATPIPTVTATTPPIDLDRVTLAITSSMFVLMDESTTLEDVERQVRAATGTAAAPVATSTPVPTATS